MPPDPRSPVPSARPPSVLDERLRASRRRWAVGVAGRGLGWGLALGGGAVVLLALLAAVGGVPDGMRPVARWLPVLLAVGPAALALVRIAARPPSDRSLALALDERHPELEFGAITLLDLPPDHPYAGRIGSRVGAVLDRAEREEAAGRGRGTGASPRAWVPPLVAASVAALMLVTAGGPVTVWTEWGMGAAHVGPRADGPEFVVAPSDADADRKDSIDLLEHLVITVHPPAYSGLPEQALDAHDEVQALAGSRVRLTATLPGEREAPRLRRIGDSEGDADFRSFDSTGDASGGDTTPGAEGTRDREWRSELQLEPSDRALVLRDDSDREWIIPLLVRSDAPPVVELLEPTRDMVLATGSGQVSFRARARDPFGIDRFELAWVHTRGSGESFDFVDGAFEWEAVEAHGEGTIEGRLTLDLDELSLGAGEVIHLRAIARDGNVVTGPGEGVSATRQIRVIREGDEMSVDALIGMPLDVEDEPVLSQRMILLMTRELIDAAPRMTADEVRAEALRISREQGRLRTRVGEDVYSRATGSMEPVVMHLGTSFDTGGGAAGTGDGSAVSGAAADPPTGASRYGVASIFDPSSGRGAGSGASGADDHDHDDHDPDDPDPPAHDHDHGDSRGDPLDFGADADISPLTLGRLGELPTGFGTLDELGHAHDGDPILSVNRALLAIHDAMWESERYLSLIEPGTAIPHQEEALERLQEMRENERVFPRGRVTVPPVDVADVRGTGEIDDASPAVRTHGQPRVDGRRWIGTLDDLLVRMNGEGSVDDDLSRAVHGFALDLLSDPTVSSDISNRVVRASRGLQEGRPDESRRILIEVRRAMDPTSSPAGRLHAATASVLTSPVSEGTDDAPGRERGTDGPGAGPSSAAPFVFATLRYQSGNWDSAPLVPQNLIHSMAQYTDLPVAPEGVVVDLASPEIFRYPLLYLTGHIPVRFSDAESRNLREYVERGGFVFMDDHNHDIDGAFHRTATAELARIFGGDALQPLPNDHELYRTFFHFDDGPPTTSHELSGWGDGLIHPELHAIEVDGRIGVLYSNKDYSSEWSYHAVNKRFLARDNTRFGVNVILYSLTR